MSLVLDGYGGGTVLTDGGDADPTTYALQGWSDTLDLVAAIEALSVSVAAGADGAFSGSLAVSFSEANTPTGSVLASGAEPDTADNTIQDSASFAITVNADSSDELCNELEKAGFRVSNEYQVIK